MPNTFNLRDPRVAMRALIGLLLLANLAAAVMAFKPFGGSADDLRRQQVALQNQLTKLQKQVEASRRLVDKVETARKEGDQFLAKFVTDKRVVTSTMEEDLVQMAKDTGVTYLPTTSTQESVEGSDTLYRMTINAGCQGTYASLSKFVNLLDKSQRFLIIESLQVQPLQSGENLTVSLKVDMYIRDQPGAGL